MLSQPHWGAGLAGCLAVPESISPQPQQDAPPSETSSSCSRSGSGAHVGPSGAVCSGPSPSIHQGDQHSCPIKSRETTCQVTCKVAQVTGPGGRGREEPGQRPRSHTPHSAAASHMTGSADGPLETASQPGQRRAWLAYSGQGSTGGQLSTGLQCWLLHLGHPQPEPQDSATADTPYGMDRPEASMRGHKARVGVRSPGVGAHEARVGESRKAQR